jgi:SPP1 gp7 family putative phage head morphogenesis protein
MYTDEQFTQLEQEERTLTDESIAIMLLILANTKGNLERELREFYQKYGRDGVVTYAEARKWVSSQDHQRRLTALTLYASIEFTSALSKMKTELEKMLKSVISKETGFFNVEIGVDALLKTPWGENYATWLDRLEADVGLWNVRITNDWTKAFLRGDTLDDVLAQLTKRFNTIDSIVESLGLSESTAIGSLARQKIFKELGITKYQFFTKPDEQRCETCGSMHGLVFPISAYEVGVTASPIHPRCRCIEIPIIE